MSILLFALLFIGAITALGMTQARLSMWAATLAALLFIWQAGILVGKPAFPLSSIWSLLAWIPVGILAALSVPEVRRKYFVKPAYDYLRKTLPKVSDTEQQALDAGTVGFDAEFFSGVPNWSILRGVPPVVLTAEEQAFLDGPTEDLCRLIDDWRIRHMEREIPDEIWDFVKKNGFLGMLISKEHGGLGFSAQAQSLILGKIASRSPDVVTIVMVPNSLGPGELIEKYGTDEQKHHYLPRLARGDEIPCFSLTGPTSGSDAATMRDIGIVEKREFQGRETLGVRLSWDKRYITLGPKATLVGLAFRLFDPDNLLGKGEDVGITVAMIPANHPGVNIGRRHLPSGAAFPNGPNWGTDVFIPVDWIIGGEKMAGQGWRMLMECLAAGRAISLPSSATAGAKAMLRFTSAYARIRRQFGLPIGRMEGIEEPLARIVEAAYANEAARGVTAAMVAAGEKPSVISAMMKYQTTERLRRALNDAMDIHGGRAICDGPANYLQSAYAMAPVGITVEGANILTRTLITFAQGALRSHPYLILEIRSAQNPDETKGLDEFEPTFLNHIAHAVSNMANAFFHNITFGYFAPAPSAVPDLKTHYRQLSRAARNFAVVSDTTIAVLGGGLKTKQKICGRLADALSELYFASCILKRFEDDGRPTADRPIVDFTVANGLARFDEALRGAVTNFPSAPVRWLLRAVVFPLGRHYAPAPDKLGSTVAGLVLKPGEVRDRLTRHIFVSKDASDPAGVLEVTLAKVVAAEEAEKKLEKAIRAGTVRRYHGIDWIEEAAKQSVVTADEAVLLREVETLVARVIAVDHFDPAELRPHYRRPGPDQRVTEQPAAAE
ncbi:MAG: acyl-CoA dehydrogenase [Hyphomicrobium sp.]|jgi:acyl-CoA dehydrogenase|nr:acyl-CoA dehydrogenase [Hyphomicrobium sp.]